MVLDYASGILAAWIRKELIKKQVTMGSYTSMTTISPIDKNGTIYTDVPLEAAADCIIKECKNDAPIVCLPNNFR